MITALLAAAVQTFSYPATVLKVVDGDTLKVNIAAFPAPFNPIEVRVYGINAPEHVMPPAKKACEVPLGIAASNYAKTLVHVGDQVTITWQTGWRDKYGRLLGNVRLKNGDDFATDMLKARQVKPYFGKTKEPWC